MPTKSSILLATTSVELGDGVGGTGVDVGGTEVCVSATDVGMGGQELVSAGRELVQLVKRRMPTTLTTRRLPPEQQETWRWISSDLLLSFYLQIGCYWGPQVIQPRSKKPKARETFGSYFMRLYCIPPLRRVQEG
jgi:hypothetical protein